MNKKTSFIILMVTVFNVLLGIATVDIYSKFKNESRLESLRDMLTIGAKVGHRMALEGKSIEETLESINNDWKQAKSLAGG